MVAVKGDTASGGSFQASRGHTTYLPPGASLIVHDLHWMTPGATNQTPPAGGFQFGPVIERIVAQAGTGNKCLIDLDTGDLTVLPDDVKVTHRLKMPLWAAEHGVDAMAHDFERRPPFRLFEARFVPTREDLNSVTPAAILKAITRPPGPFALPGNDQLTTWFFKTREGGVGILQIVGFTDEPRTVKIRYKLVRDAANRQEPGPDR